MPTIAELLALIMAHNPDSTRAETIAELRRLAVEAMVYADELDADRRLRRPDAAGLLC